MVIETENTFVWGSNVYQEVGLRSVVIETRNTFVWASNVYLEVAEICVYRNKNTFVWASMYTRK